MRKVLIISKTDKLAREVTGRLVIGSPSTLPGRRKGIATLSSDTVDRKLFILDYYSKTEKQSARILNDVAKNEIATWIPEEFYIGRDNIKSVKSINNVKPTEAGDFFVTLDPCMSTRTGDFRTNINIGRHLRLTKEGLGYLATGLHIYDYCPACESNCDALETLKNAIRKIRLELNCIKDAMLPYPQQQFNNRLEYAMMRFKQTDNPDESLTVAMNIIARYIAVVNKINLAVMLSNKGSVFNSVKEDLTGVTVQMAHAFPGVIEPVNVAATLTIEPSDVSDVDYVSVLIMGTPALYLKEQDGTSRSLRVDIEHVSAVKKVMRSDSVRISKNASCMLSLSVTFIPFIYIKARDTSGRAVSLKDIDLSTYTQSAGSSSNNGFVYQKDTIKTGLDLPVYPQQLNRATVEDYNEAKLYPTRNVEGVDRWKFTLQWSVGTASGRRVGTDIFYFETSKVKQPVYDLVTDSTWITKITVE